MNFLDAVASVFATGLVMLIFVTQTKFEKSKVRAKAHVRGKVRTPQQNNR